MSTSLLGEALLDQLQQLLHVHGWTYAWEVIVSYYIYVSKSSPQLTITQRMGAFGNLQPRAGCLEWDGPLTSGGRPKGSIQVHCKNYLDWYISHI